MFHPYTEGTFLPPAGGMNSDSPSRRALLTLFVAASRKRSTCPPARAGARCTQPKRCATPAPPPTIRHCADMRRQQKARASRYTPCAAADATSVFLLTHAIIPRNMPPYATAIVLSPAHSADTFRHTLFEEDAFATRAEAAASSLRFVRDVAMPPPPELIAAAACRHDAPAKRRQTKCAARRGTCQNAA